MFPLKSKQIFWKARKKAFFIVRWLNEYMIGGAILGLFTIYPPLPHTPYIESENFGLPHPL